MDPSSPSSYYHDPSVPSEEVVDGISNPLRPLDILLLPPQPAWATTGHHAAGPQQQSQQLHVLHPHQGEEPVLKGVNSSAPLPIGAPHDDSQEQQQQQQEQHSNSVSQRPFPNSSSSSKSKKLKKRPMSESSPTSFPTTKRASGSHGTLAAATAAATTDESNTNNKRRRLCKFPHCDRVVKSQGHCQRHGAKPKRCKIDGCEKQAQGTHDGMCKRHWRRAVFPQEPPPEGTGLDAISASVAAPAAVMMEMTATTAEEPLQQQQPAASASALLLASTSNSNRRNEDHEAVAAVIMGDHGGGAGDADDADDAPAGGLVPCSASVYETILPQSLAYKPTQWVIRSSIELQQQQQQQQQDHHYHHHNNTTGGTTTTTTTTTVSFPDGGVVMPLVEHLHKGMEREFGWHRLEERRARGGCVPSATHNFSLSTQFETWERQLVRLAGRQYCLASTAHHTQAHPFNICWCVMLPPI
jgi:hypothetical protein